MSILTRTKLIFYTLMESIELTLSILYCMLSSITFTACVGGCRHEPGGVRKSTWMEAGKREEGSRIVLMCSSHFHVA